MKRLKLHVSKENQETINKYNQDCKIVENLRPSSLRNNNVFLRKLADYLGNKTFKECTIDDLKRFFDIVNYNDKEPLKVAIRKFYKWLYQTDDYPPIVKWIKLKTMKQRLEEREIDSIKKKIVPIEEFQKMVSHVSHDMQMQAILEILYWIGCRVGELVSMNLRDIEIHEDFVLFSIRESKTKKRQVPLKEHYPELFIRWLDNHPLKSNPDAPLFVSFNRRCWHDRLSVHYIEQNFRIICKELKMKRITPHFFRHTAISRDLANGMPNTHITTKYGWEKDTVMLRIYDHNDNNELIKFVTGKPKNTPSPSIDILQQQKQRIEKEITEKDQLKARVESMERTIQILNSKFTQQFIQNGGSMEEAPSAYNNLDKFIQDQISQAKQKVRGATPEQIRKFEEAMKSLMA